MFTPKAMLSRGSFSGPSGGGGLSGSFSGGRQAVTRTRSSTLRRAGTSLSAEVSSLASSGNFGAAGLQQESSALLPPGAPLGPAAAGASEPVTAAPEALEAPVVHVASEEPSGLTPASLKHLKRKHEALLEEKVRLQSEIAGLQAREKEQRQRVSALEEEAQEAKAREAALEEKAQAAREAEEEQRCRAVEVEQRCERLEELLAAREAELARLREALEQQRRLTREVCEAAECRTVEQPEVDTSEFEQRIKGLEAERRSLLEEKAQQAMELEDLRRAAAGAMAAAEKAMALHAVHLQRAEALRAAKLMEAINNKVELHISVPRVTLSYNDAPPLAVSAAMGLSDGKIRDFLDRDVFPHFEPLWVRIDALDRAPDGSTKRAYATKMLERLTDAVKAFIMKSQTAEAGADLCLTAGDLPPKGSEGAPPGGAREKGSGLPSGGHAGGAISAATAAIAGGVQKRAAGAGREAAAGAAGAEAAAGDSNGLSEADRKQLLSLLRSGDDRGLGSKLSELLAGQA